MKAHHITVQRPGATSVSIAGSFNDWNPSETPMLNAGDGAWAVELVLPPGRYEYRFIADGEWIDDPGAAESVGTAFGSRNGVIAVG
jgi:1,4-alpha-glucan branching enzyme